MFTHGALHPVINASARQQHLAHFWVVDSPLQLEHCYSSWLVRCSRSIWTDLAEQAWCRHRTLRKLRSEHGWLTGESSQRWALAKVGLAVEFEKYRTHLRSPKLLAEALQQRANDLTEAALASLYHANFLHNRSLVALQAVAYLSLSGRTASNFSAITTLVDHAVVSAQHLQLGAGYAGLGATPATTPEERDVRIAALEVRKRIVRALCISHWCYSEVACKLSSRASDRQRT